MTRRIPFKYTCHKNALKLARKSEYRFRCRPRYSIACVTAFNQLGRYRRRPSWLPVRNQWGRVRPFTRTGIQNCRDRMPVLRRSGMSSQQTVQPLERIRRTLSACQDHPTILGARCRRELGPLVVRHRGRPPTTDCSLHSRLRWPSPERAGDWAGQPGSVSKTGMSRLPFLGPRDASKQSCEQLAVVIRWVSSVFFI
jgi:hypothetical protein